MSPRRIAPFLVALAAVIGCKSVTQEPPPQELVIAPVDSAAGLIPTPNDLALQGSRTIPLAAQRSLLQQFVKAGGFPSDQGVPVSVPLYRYTWDGGTNTYARATAPGAQPVIDPASVVTTGAARNVVVVKVDVTPPQVVDVVLDAESSTTAVTLQGTWYGRLGLRKVPDANGSRRWAPGRYAFAVRGGSGGVRTRSGTSIVADRAIAMVAPNLDLKNPKNLPIGMDPTNPEVSAQLDLLENVRSALWGQVSWVSSTLTSSISAWNQTPDTAITPAFVAVGSFMAPSEVAAIGTFSVSPAIATASVDSDSGLAPLPLDLLRTGPLSVATPTCAGGNRTIGFNPAFAAAAQGLTSLDGFSTTALAFAPVTVPLDAGTVNGSTVLLYKRTGPGTWARQLELKEELGKIGRLGPGCIGTTCNPAAAAYVAEPDPITVASGAPVAAGVTCPASFLKGCSTIVGLQAGVGAPLPSDFQALIDAHALPPTVYLPPLDEGTDYAVVITTSVRTMAGYLTRSTMGHMLLDAGYDPVVLNSTTSLLSGVSNETALAIQTMRNQLADVTAQFTTDTGRASADVAMAYTFRTQGCIKSTALGLVMAPYQAGSNVAGAATFLSTTAVSGLYGIDGKYLTSPAGLAGFAEVPVQTRNYLPLAAANPSPSANSGALDPLNVETETVTALVAYPDPATPGTVACPSGVGFGSASCYPLVIYSHGLKNTKADMLPIAASLTSRGFIVAAIDAPKHGERSYCSGATQAAANEMCCPSALNAGQAAALCGGSTCVAKPNLVTAVDKNPDGSNMVVGVCETAGGAPRYLSYRADFRDPNGPCGGSAWNDAAETSPKPVCFSPKGNAVASANRFVTVNFFRVRDTMRQDLVDKSALVKALAPPSPALDPYFAPSLLEHGVAVHPGHVYVVAHSFGAITGGATLTVNPRITAAAVAAPGATALDTFSNPQSRYYALLVQLLSQAGAQPGTADFMKFLQIGKWILDPADPANFLGFSRGSVLPNPMYGTAAAALVPGLTDQPTQPARQFLVQISNNDGSVPNAQNQYWAARAGYTVPLKTESASNTNVQWYVDPGDLTTTIGHSTLLDFVRPTLTEQAQANAGDFLRGVAQSTPVNP